MIPVGAVWPRPVPTSALVIGSVVPDWPLYLPVGPAYATTHSLVGVLGFCVPVGFALFLLFQFLLKRPLFELLPAYFRQRLWRFVQAPWVFRFHTLVGVVIALALGSMVHVAWDSFTHKGQWGVENVDALRNVLFVVADVEVHVYKLLQHGSTAVGGLVLLLFLVFWFRGRLPESIPASRLVAWQRTTAIGALILIPLLFGGLSALEVLAGGINYIAFRQALFDAITQTVFVFLMMVCGYCVLFRLISPSSRALDISL